MNKSINKLDLNDEKNKPTSILSYDDLEKSELIQIIKSVDINLSGVFNLNFIVSDKFYEIIKKNNIIKLFNKNSLSTYFPLYSFEDQVMKGLMSWDYISTRTDLTMDFITKYIKKLNLSNILENNKLSYNFINKCLNKCTYIYEHYYWIDSFNKISKHILLSDHLEYKEKLQLIKVYINNIISRYATNPSMDIKFLKADLSVIHSIYLNNIFDKTDGLSFVKFIQLLRVIKPVMNLLFSNEIFKFFNKDKHSLLTKFEWIYLINNELIGYPSNNLQISQSVLKIFVENVTKFEIIHIHETLNYYDIDKLITVKFNNINIDVFLKKFSQIMIPNLIPYWFLKKYQKELDWTALILNIIQKYNTDQINPDIFLQWFNDNINFILISVTDFIKLNKCHIPEILLEKYINHHNLFPESSMITIFANQNISIKTIEIIAPFISDKEWDQISLCQILSPEFIKKYKKKLNWDNLAFNPTWQLFPHDQFDKLPKFDDKNEMLWMSLDQKVKKISSILATADKNAIVILSGSYITIKSNRISTARTNIEHIKTHCFLPDNYDLNYIILKKTAPHANLPSIHKYINLYDNYADKDHEFTSFGPELIVYKDLSHNNHAPYYYSSGINIRFN